MTEEIKGVPQPLPDHECKYCKTVHAGCCSKACVLKKSPNYPLPSVLTESRPQTFTTSPTSGVHAPVAVSTDQPQPLAELPRKLAEKWRRCVGSDDLCQELERDIRRAMLEFAERAEQSIKNCVINDREYFAAAIRELAEELDNDSRMQLLG